MEIDKTRALMKECFALSWQKFEKDFYNLDEDQIDEIIEEAEEKILS